VEDEFQSEWCWPDTIQTKSDLLAGLAWHGKCLELASVSKMQSQDYLEGYLLTLTAGTFDGVADGEFFWHRDTPTHQARRHSLG
jgi:hypothetical protein